MQRRRSETLFGLFCILGLAVVSACSSAGGDRRELELTKQTTRVQESFGGQLFDDGPEIPPNLTIPQGYVAPDTGNQNSTVIDRSQGLADLAALRISEEEAYVPEGFASGPVTACGPANCTSPNECISNACSSPCTEAPCPAGTTQGTDPGGACFCIPSESTGPGPSTGSCGWTHVGPTNIPGRVMDIAIDPNNASHVFAATVGGVWRSTDTARTWQRVSDAFTGSKAESVAVDPANSNEVVAGLGDDQNGGIVITGSGIWMSTSGGDPGTWTNVSPASLNSSVVSHLAYAPDGSQIYAATSAGPYVGTRSGTGITFAPLGSLSFQVDSLEVDSSTTPPTVYAGVRNAGTSSGVWKYNGTTWTQKSSGLPNASLRRVTVALSKNNPSLLFAKITASDGSLAGVFKTTTAAEPVSDGGPAWASLAGASTLNDSTATVGGVTYSYSYYNSVLKIDPTNDNDLLSGGVGLYRSTDGGQSWKNVSSGTDTTNFPAGIHGDQHAVAFDPTNHGLVYVGNDGGIFKSTDMTSSAWHWNASAHGMATTEFYDIATQQKTASLAAGGSQDNGTEITFGNHTWYQPGGCDGSVVSIDAANDMTMYSNCNGGPSVIVQPVPWAASGVQTVASTLPAGISLGLPIVSDPTVGGVALAAGTLNDKSNNVILQATKNVNWTTAFTPPAGSTISIGAFDSRHLLAISQIANGSGKKTYLAWIQTPTGANVYNSQDSGATWNAGNGLTVASSVSGFAIDPTNATHAFAATTGAVGGNVFVTQDGGGTWTQVTSAAGTSIPTGAVRNIVFDPTNSNVIYAAHQVGVFKGTVSGSSVSWVTFDEGLPNGVDVKDIAVDPPANTLTIGTFGYGSYVRNLGAGATCPQQFLVVRDTVFDQGQSPSTSGVPDPEHPIADPSNAGFFKADDTAGGKVYFWDSTDIRIDIPANDAAKNKIASADNVEFETCPVEVSNCPQGAMVDTNPVRNASTNAYVQVANRGLQPSSNVRVLAMFTDATTQVPDLPSDFWTTTLPAGSTSCGALNSSSPWHLVGCGVIPVVNPDYPAVIQFPWTVPQSAADHSCMLVVVESTDDPISSTVRGQLSTESLVQTDRHIAQRNLHIINAPQAPASGGPPPGSGVPPFTGLTSVLVPNRTTSAPTRTVLLSRSGMGNGRLSFLLPPGVAKNVSGLPPACGGSGTVASGSKVVTIPFPKGVTEQLAGAEANGNLIIGNGVQLQAPGGGFAGVANAGTLLATNIGGNAQVGNVVSGPLLTLNTGSVVNGFVETSSPIVQFPGATITGGITTSATLTPSDQLAWQVALPSGTGTNVDVGPKHTQQIAPGNYGLVSVEGGATLSLSSGTYFIDTLDIDNGATVAANTSAGPVVVYIRTNIIDTGGAVTDTPGAGANVLFVYLGILPIGVPGPFAGTFVAPKALLTVGGGAVSGAFFAQNLTIQSGTTLSWLPFAGWGNVGACEALTSTEKTSASQLGLDSTAVYPVTGNETQVVLPIAPGNQLTLGLRYESGSGPADSAARFRAISLDGTTVLGGSTFVVRRR